MEEVTATTLAKLTRKKDHMLYMGVINEASLYAIEDTARNSQEKAVKRQDSLKPEHKPVLKDFYEKHGVKIDQFVDNIINC